MIQLALWAPFGFRWIAVDVSAFIALGDPVGEPAAPEATFGGKSGWLPGIRCLGAWVAFWLQSICHLASRVGIFPPTRLGTPMNQLLNCGCPSWGLVWLPGPMHGP